MSSLVNPKYTLTGTTVLVLEAFISMLNREFPQLNYVYSQTPDILESVSKYVDDLPKTGNPEKDIFPLFSFRRSALRWNDLAGTGRRSTVQYHSAIKEVENRSYIYRTLSGIFTLDFIYLDSSIERMEQFEVMYLANKSLAQQNELEVDLFDLGKFPYYLRYNELKDMSFSRKGIHYQGISGSITFTGWFFVLIGAAPFITQINLKIQSFLKEVFYTTTIV